MQSRGVTPRLEPATPRAVGALPCAGLAQSLLGWEGGDVSPLCRLLGKGCPKAGPSRVTSCPTLHTWHGSSAVQRWFSCTTLWANRAVRCFWSTSWPCPVLRHCWPRASPFPVAAAVESHALIFLATASSAAAGPVKRLCLPEGLWGVCVCDACVGKGKRQYKELLFPP